MVMVFIDKYFAGANGFEMPAPTWGTHGRVACARDVAVDDALAMATLDAKHKYPGRLATRYDHCNGSASTQPEVRHGELLKLGRIAPGMGHSQRPHLGLHWDGAPNGPTGYGGGGTWPPQDFVRGGDQVVKEILFLRLLQHRGARCKLQGVAYHVHSWRR